MSGSYNLTLVFASYCVAVIAAYSAIYFGTKLFDMTGPARKFWLATGAACLGTGIWSMHFVGMSAYTMPMEMPMSFSLSLTIASWVPAVLASALALTVITRPTASAKSVVASAVIMGAGISAMHYGGMYAMRMDPPIQYDSLIVAISVIIAVVASGAALVICRQVRVVPKRYALVTKAVAALVMGAAICGMHYTGMAAASYPMGAEMAASNALSGQWMGIPTAIVASVFLLLSLIVAYQDFRQAERERREQVVHAQKIHKDAFHDAATGLGNRSYFEQRVMSRLARKEAGQGFTLIYVDVTQYRELVASEGEEAAGELMRSFASALASQVADTEELSRYTSSSFMMLLPRTGTSEIASIAARLRELMAGHAYAQRFGQWSLGYSHYPDSATNSRLLMREAQRTRYTFSDQATAPLAEALT
ncbi:MHYT domain-containing protein [Gilvimarinus algae]|uniref:MHYT domain-containing protein n=1 Tax=Gilvimarinus algae TaxID=3058037 RepID=A0ABT8TEB9_9GAMM|nr:MHYT domain-containing protein [Gilvimarinus sp. SDUM040014]MDO3381879.1 MHYT domain-containing protein [Gilvimarinus sp. SDUM040014]